MPTAQDNATFMQFCHQALDAQPEHMQAVLEAVGYDAVRAAVDAQAISSAMNRATAVRFVNKIDRAEQAKQRADEIARAQAAIDAATKAANASESAARWAAIAAWVGLAGVFVALAIALYKGELPGPM